MAPTLARIMPLLLPLTVSPAVEAPAPSPGPHPQPSAHLTQARHVAHEPPSSAVVLADGQGELSIVAQAQADLLFSKSEVHLEGVTMGPLVERASCDEDEHVYNRKGLSPKMMHRNEFLASAKALKCGGKLSGLELVDLKSWQSSPPLVVAKKSSPPHGGIWGGGCLYSPTSACELWRHIKETGWPSDEEVHGDKSCFVDAEEGIDFSDYAMFDCLGCLRSASGICQKDFERDPRSASCTKALRTTSRTWRGRGSLRAA